MPPPTSLLPHNPPPTKRLESPFATKTTIITTPSPTPAIKAALGILATLAILSIISTIYLYLRLRKLKVPLFPFSSTTISSSSSSSSSTTAFARSISSSRPPQTSSSSSSSSSQTLFTGGGGSEYHSKDTTFMYANKPELPPTYSHIRGTTYEETTTQRFNKYELPIHADMPGVYAGPTAATVGVGSAGQYYELANRHGVMELEAASGSEYGGGGAAAGQGGGGAAVAVAGVGGGASNVGNKERPPSYAGRLDYRAGPVQERMSRRESVWARGRS